MFRAVRNTQCSFSCSHVGSGLAPLIRTTSRFKILRDGRNSKELEPPTDLDSGGRSHQPDNTVNRYICWSSIRLKKPEYLACCIALVVALAWPGRFGVSVQLLHAISLAGMFTMVNRLSIIHVITQPNYFETVDTSIAVI